MKIKEKDFTIEHNGDCWAIHCLKSKKELKENSKETYKTLGYYTNIYNALHAALKWRKDKKYPFSEPTAEYAIALRKYRIADILLLSTASLIYFPIFAFKKQVFDADRQI